jgi:signal transduction histidine kinase
MRPSTPARYGGRVMSVKRGETRSDRCMGWLSSTSIVFPTAALIVSILTFFTTTPTPAIVGVLAIALLPWALVAGGLRIPPLVVVVVTIAAMAWLVIRLDDQATMFLGVCACAWAAAQGLRFESAVAVLGGVGVAIACEFIAPKDDTKSDWVIWATGMLFGFFTGALLHRQERLMSELRLAHDALDVAAIDGERKQIAREVHDIVGHSLTVVLLNIAGARRNLSKNPAAAAEALERVESVSRDSLDTVRSIVGLLSNGGDSQRDAPLPGGGDIIPLVDQASASGLRITSRIDGDPASLEPAVGLTVIRVLQEALSNASRHAPGELIDLTITIHDEYVNVSVSNPIPSFHLATPVHDGLGVSSMRSRVAAAQGEAEIGMRDGSWVVRCTMPRSLHRAPLSGSRP